MWQLADQLRMQVISLTGGGPSVRDLRFRDNARAAASSIPANIAEGFARASHAEFARFLDYAHGSLTETDDCIRDGVIRGYWSDDEAEPARTSIRRLTPALRRLRYYLKSTRRPT